MTPGATARPAAAGLDVSFFERSVHEVARDLVGCSLRFGGAGGMIVETESYERDDPACHAYVGLTPRTEVLFGPPAHAYVYLSYGIHSLLNFVAEPEGAAAAVLIRALEPVWGLDEMRHRRGLTDARALCCGPGKLTEALGIGLDSNRAPRRPSRPSSSTRERRSGAGSRSPPGRGSGSASRPNGRGASAPAGARSCRGRCAERRRASSTTAVVSVSSSSSFVPRSSWSSSQAVTTSAKIRAGKVPPSTGGAGELGLHRGDGCRRGRPRRRP